MELNRKYVLTKIVGSCCSAGSTITSLGCMAIMTATIAATGAVTISSMGAMGTTSPESFSLKLLDFIGLEFLTKINLKTLEFILITLLLIGIISACISYKYHKNIFTLVLTIVSSILIYMSIFVVMSNPVYYISLVGLIVSTALNLRGKLDGNRK